MLLNIYLVVVFCAAISMMLVSAVVFIQDKKLFSSAPKEVYEAIQPRNNELFYGAKAIGWALLVFSILISAGVFILLIWDGFRNDYTFSMFFFRFLFILMSYKIFDMVCIDYFLLIKYKFFQYFYPETKNALVHRKYGFNIKSQLLKLFIIFPLLSALIAWLCTYIIK